MKFSFTGRHMDIGEALTNRARDACSALADKYGTEFIDMSIVMKKDSYRFLCDISCKTASGTEYHISDESDDPTVCFDVTLQKVEQQMQKKKKTCCRGCSKKCFVDMPVFANEEKDAEPMIVAETLDDLPLLSVSEASRRLNDQVKIVVFENVSDNTVNVVYKRDDNNIGWINYKVKK